MLKAQLEETEGPILYSVYLVGVGQEMFGHAAKLNWEGIVSKKADAPYRSDRNEAWLKIKTSQRARFPVVGFVKDPTGVAALYLGTREHWQGRHRLVPHRVQPDRLQFFAGSFEGAREGP